VEEEQSGYLLGYVIRFILKDGASSGCHESCVTTISNLIISATNSRLGHQHQSSPDQDILDAPSRISV